jgi:hypothetical protein
MTDNEKELPLMNIPEVYQEFCKEVGRIARKYNLHEFRGTFRPGYRSGPHWQDEIEFSWEQGRPGIATGAINITKIQLKFIQTHGV